MTFTKLMLVSTLKKKLHFKWFHFYFLLAAFEVVTVFISLFLSHTIIQSYSDASIVNEAWMKKLYHLSSIRELAQKVNGPGNDVFDSKDWKTESLKMKTALDEFNQDYTNFEISISNNNYEENKARLKELIEGVKDSMKNMVLESNNIFNYFEKNNFEKAASRMASMDKKYALLNTAIGSIEKEIMKIQTEHISKQLLATQKLRSREFMLVFWSSNFIRNESIPQQTKSSQ